MNNMYDILAKINLLEGRGSKPDFLDLDKDGNKKEPMKQAADQAKTVDEGSTGDYSAKKARAGKDIGKPGKQFAKIAKSAGERYGSKERGEKVAGAVLAKLRAKESVEEAAKPDYIDLDKDGNKKESMKKAAQDRKRMKESLRLVKETSLGDRSVKVYHDREYREYHVCVTEGDRVVSRQFAGNTQEATALVRSIVSEARGQKAAFPGTDEYKRQHGTDIEAFRLRHAPSVMRDPEARKGLAKMDTEHDRLKKMRRGEIDPDEVDTGTPAGEKRGRGRPKGSKRAIGAKGPTGRSKLMRMEEDYDKDEYDEEGEMAMSQARTIEDAAEELQSILDADENLPEWVQKKISLAKEYIDSARDYLKANRPGEEMDESALQAYLGKKKYGKEGMSALQKAGREGASKEKMAKIRASHDKLDEEDLEEKAVSKAQRAAAGIAYAARKGDIPKSELRGASKEMAKMPSGELKKFAKTKEKGLPEKKDEAVEETTTAGSVATAPAEGEKKSKGGIQFGKGIYEAQLAESFDAAMTQVLGEGTTITINSPDQGEPSVSINGTGEDAMALSELLKMAGLFSAGGYKASCPMCGQMHEGQCMRQVDEELANSADNTETMDTDYMVNKLAGGLNGPKLQVNPNNPGDNAMAMTDLGKRAAASVNLGAIAEQIEHEEQTRLLDLYRKIS